MATNYANVMSANASGQVTGIGNVLKVCSRSLSSDVASMLEYPRYKDPG